MALLGEPLIAAVRFTPITIGGVGGALLLGPLAVDPDFAGQGFGRRLIGEAMEAAKAAGVKLVVLVGDEPYYGRFGFRPVPLGQITLPGPVDPQRLLAAELEPGALAAFRGLDRTATRVMTRQMTGAHSRLDLPRDGAAGRRDDGQAVIAQRRRRTADRAVAAEAAGARAKTSAGHCRTMPSSCRWPSTRRRMATIRSAR